MNFTYQKLIGIFIVSILLFVPNMRAQIISLGFGPNYTVTNQKKQMINGSNYFDNTDYSLNISYEHLNSKWSYLISFTRFDGCTFISFEEGSVIAPDGFPVLADGFCGVDVWRMDFGLVYNLTNEQNKFFFKANINLGLQVTKTNGWEFYSELFKIDGPDYFELEPVRTESYNTIQLVPSVGFKTGYVFWKRIELSFQIQGVYGFKSFQEMHFKYAYKGEVQETAVFETRGTGIFTSLNIGYRFKKKE